MDEARFNEIVALGKSPISDASPVGDPVRYDEVFETLQAQLDKIGSLTGEEPDWGEVVSLSTDILKSKSKDLLVITYLAVGLFEKDGYAALAAAFDAYKEFINSFWEKCFPKVKPPQGRLNAVQYLADRVHPAITLKGGKCRKQPSAAEKEAVHQCAEKAGEFSEAVDKAFNDPVNSPNLMPMVRAFKALKTMVGPLVAEPPPEAAQPAAAAPPTGGETAPAAAPAPAAGAGVPEQFSSTTQATQAIIKVAKYLFGQDNKDARAFRLMRAVHFGGLAQAPKDRILPPVPKPRQTFFGTTAASGNWVNLLVEAEGQFAVTPLWLDLQRFVCQALGNLGAPYEAAKQAVAFECVALYSRLPDVFDLSFKDGTPFADGATRAWLEEVRGEFGGGGGGGGGGNDALGKGLAEARKLLGAAKASEAVKCLSAVIDSSGSRRQRFQAQLALAGICVDMNRLALAESLLSGLETTMDQFNVDEWEPDLASEAMARLYECLRKSKPKPTPDDQRRHNAVFARLCRLNPAAALKLDNSAAKK